MIILIFLLIGLQSIHTLYTEGQSINQMSPQFYRVLVRWANCERDTRTIGKMDPYITLEKDGQKQKTTVHKKGGKLGKWDQFFFFERKGSYELVLTAMDDGVFGSQAIGRAWVDLSNFKQANQQYQEIATLYYNKEKIGNLYLVITLQNNHNKLQSHNSLNSNGSNSPSYRPHQQPQLNSYNSSSPNVNSYNYVNPYGSENFDSQPENQYNVPEFGYFGDQSENQQQMIRKQQERQAQLEKQREERRKLQLQKEELQSMTKCCICFQNPKDCLSTTCMHLCCCFQCGKKTKLCPICRAQMVPKKIYN